MIWKAGITCNVIVTVTVNITCNWKLFNDTLLQYLENSNFRIAIDYQSIFNYPQPIYRDCFSWDSTFCFIYIYVCKVFYVSDFISKDDFIFQGTNEINGKLWKTMNADRRIHMVPLKVNGIYFLWFTPCSSMTESRDVVYAWNVIHELTDREFKTSNPGTIW